jgi:hypothetical protein
MPLRYRLPLPRLVSARRGRRAGRRVAGGLPRRGGRTELGTRRSLTAPAERRNMTPVMAERVTRRSRLFAGALALAVAFASSAICFVAAAQMADVQQHACCAGMSQDCGDSVSVQQDCCAVQSADLTAVARAAQSAAVPVVVNVVVLDQQPRVMLPPARAFAPGVPKPSSHPTYLLVSLFRL